MKISKYLKDKKFSMFIFLLESFIMFGMLLAFKVSTELITAILMMHYLTGMSLLIIDICRKKKFYDTLVNNTSAMDKKYLVLEIIEKPNFYEGEIVYEQQYEINKSMLEEMNDYKEKIDDFKEYIEAWIHEAKIPISSLVLMCHNNKNDNGKQSMNEKYIMQIKRLDQYIDQVLYYMRSNYTENDYLIKETKLDKTVANVMMKNKDELLERNINISVDTNGLSVMTDAKWLEFILNQIINNSMKYKKENADAVIWVTAKAEPDRVILSVYDNGIGIPQKDIANVFKKTFTGENGRKCAKSTGMGLYIAKKLCVKLGHKIEIASEENQWTRVAITFGGNDYYRMDHV